MRKHRHGVADADAAALRAGEAGRHDVGAHQHLLVGEPVRHRSEVRHGIGHQHVFGLASVDGVAEAPAAQRLPAVLGAGPVLGMAAAQAGLAVPARRDRTGDDPLALAVALHGRAELLDHADRLVADGQPSGHRILALEDVDVGAADRGGGDADERIERTDIRDRLLVEDDAAGLDEDGDFHLGHRHLPKARRR